MKQKIKHLQSSGETRKTNRTWHFLSTLNSLLLSKLLLLLIIPAMGSTAAWAADPVVTYTYESSKPKATLADNDYFSAASGPTASNSDCSFSNNSNGLTCTLKKSTSSTITFTFTAKTSFELRSFTINSYTNSDNIKSATVDYYKGSNEPTNTSVEFATSNLGNKTINPTSPISLSNGDVFTVKVNLTNNDASNGRFWRIKTITLTPSAGSTPTLKSIAVSNPPTKTTYTEGETFNPAGLVISKTMSDDTSGGTVAYSGHESYFTFSPTTALTTSDTEVTITYDGKYTTQPITVNAAASTYSVTYNTNGLTLDSGSVPSDGNSYKEGDNITVLGNPNSMAKSGYTFLGWSTTSGYSSTYKTADETITMGTANVTLYAQWKLNPSLESSSPSFGTVVTDGSISTTASSPATGMFLGQASSEFDAATLKTTTLRGTSFTTTLNSSDAGGTQVLSILLTDGTFYSDVITHSYTVGVATPDISCSSNTVTITCATDGAEIYYTTDGNPPSSSSTAYSATGPFSIDADCTVKAIAIKNEKNSDVASRACTHEDISVSTTLPVTYDFRNTTKWTESGNIGTSGSGLAELTNRAEEDDNHSFYIRKSAPNKFTLEKGVKLSMNDNGSTSNFIAIPISGINSRIDIDVWVPYNEKQSYTLKYALVTGTTTPSASGTNLGNFKSANKYVEDHFNFRIENISASNGVLYLGRGQSNWPDMYQIRITTLESSISADPESVTIKDNASPAEVTVTNNTAYNVRINGAPDASVATAWYDPATNKLKVTPVASGTTSVELYVDENGNGTKEIEETKTLSVPVTVQGITIGSQPSSQRVTTGSSATALSVSAAFNNSGTGELKHQWYKNTVNSNTGGEAISGATSATLSSDKIDTSADESALFYYCVVSATGYKSQTSNVVYVLTSKTKRYFHMSNVAGNKETSADGEKITGQVIAGGNAYVQTSGNYRYITRPNTNVAHMYVANNDNKYFKVTVDGGVKNSTDVITVTLNGIDTNARGIEIYNAEFSNHVTLTTGSDGSVKTYYGQAGSLSGETTLYIKGIASLETNFFTDLYISEKIAITATVAPATQSIASGTAPNTLTVTASGGVGNYSYQWKAKAPGAADYSNVGTDSPTYAPGTLTTTGDYSYKCVVTSGLDSEESNIATVTVAASATHGFYVPSFTDGENTYTLSDTNYGDQNSGSVTTTTHFWTIDDGVASWSSNRLQLSTHKTSKVYDQCAKMTFYVKNAQYFKLKTTGSMSYKISIDGGDDISVTAGSDYTSIYNLNPEGSYITLTATNTTAVKPDNFVFYEYIHEDPTMSIRYGGEAVTTTSIYVDDTAKQFEVSSNSTGALSLTIPGGADAITNGYQTTYLTVTLVNGTLTVTPRGTVTPSAQTIEVRQAALGNYNAGSTSMTVTVKKHQLTLNFALSQINVNASLLTKNGVVPAGSKPTFRADIDGVEQTGDALTALGIKFLSDDITIVDFGNEADYSTLTYKGGQGSAKIYAYESGTYNVKTDFDFIVEAGKNNDADEATSTVAEQQTFLLQDDDGSSLVTMTYGGYRYNTTTKYWNGKDSKPGAKIDDHAKYIRHNDDALDEYKRQLRGMLDETTDQTKALSGAPDADFWYETTEDKPNGGGKYSKYERIRPFTLPCRGGYLKFDVHKTGQMTVYIWQNGQIDDKKGIGSKPRLGYWFDEEGWVQRPIVAPITKDKISGGSDNSSTFSKKGKLTDLMPSRWLEANGDLEMHKLLKYKYCKVANPTENTDKNQFHENNTDSGWESAYENPYYWMTSAEITANNALTMPKKMTPVPYHNGYMIHEDSYLKYVLNVVAGKTYYFFGMLTKIGYAGMNFIVDDVVDAGDGYTSVAETLDVHTEDALHLNNTDNMTEKVNGLSHAYTVYNEVTLPSNYRAGKWNTICLPFALSEEQVEEAFGKGTELTLYNGLIKKGTDYTIKYLSHVDRNILPGQPYFIKPSGKDANNSPLPMVGEIIGSEVDTNNDGKTDGTRITFSNVVIDKNHFNIATCKYNNEKDVDGSGAAIEGDGSYEFVGAYANPVIEPYSYLIHPSTGNIKQYTGATNSANKLNTYRAYLKPKSEDIKHMSLDTDFTEVREYTWLDNDDDPTGVKSLEEEVVDALNSGKMVMPNKAYNLMGQEIDPRSAKGLVIINGKKVMY